MSLGLCGLGQGQAGSQAVLGGQDWSETRTRCRRGSGGPPHWERTAGSAALGPDGGGRGGSPEEVQAEGTVWLSVQGGWWPLGHPQLWDHVGGRRGKGEQETPSGEPGAPRAAEEERRPRLL